MGLQSPDPDPNVLRKVQVGKHTSMVCSSKKTKLEYKLSDLPAEEESCKQWYGACAEPYSARGLHGEALARWREGETACRDPSAVVKDSYRKSMRALYRLC